MFGPVKRSPGSQRWLPAWGLVILLAVGTSIALAQREAPPSAAPLTGSSTLSPVAAPINPLAPVDGPVSGQPPARPEPIDFPTTALDITVKLLIVLAIAYGCLALVRRFGPGGLGRERRGQLQVLESATIAPNRSVVLIRAHDRQILLGVTPSSISLLTEWDADQIGGVAAPFADAMTSVLETAPRAVV